jgi:type IV pilus assembly protein PilA
MRRQFLIGLFCLGSFVSGVAAATVVPTAFRDVPKSHWAYDAIQWASEAGIMNGAGSNPGYFQPNGTLTRAEIAVISQRLYKKMLERQATFEQTMAIQGSKGQLQDAYNAQRRSDVNTILNAIYQYGIDNNGKMPASLSSTDQEICMSHVTKCSGVNLDILLETYLVSIPADPSVDKNATLTGYAISKAADGKITIKALKAEGTIIQVWR